LAANPKFTFDYKRGVANPKYFSFLNMINFNGHFKVDYDPTGYKSAVEKFEKEVKENKVLIKDGRYIVQNEKSIEFFEELESKQEELKKAATEEEKKTIQKHIDDLNRVRNKAVHEVTHPRFYEKKFLTLEGDVENKFDNDDIAKFKYGSSNHFESTFTMKNLIDENATLEADACGKVYKNYFSIFNSKTYQNKK